MIEYLIQSSTLEDIADAIRTKTGGSGLINPEDMANEIANISVGSSVTAQDILDKIFPAGDILLELTAFGTTATANQAYVFKGNTKIEKVTFSAKQGVTTPTIPDRSFASTKVKRISQLNDLPVIHVGASAFEYATSLEIVALQNCGNMYTSAFEGCSNLTVAEFGQAEFFRNYILRNCTKLETLILRGTSVCTLTATNCFDNTPFASGKTGGTLYVPRALISSYQSATNWSTILGYTNNQILSIEGSYYETHHADGALIST